jgi:hypothetical protein
MAISLVGYTTVVTTSSSTTIVTNVPSGVQSGDLMLVQLCVYGTVNLSFPSGWNVLTRWWNYSSTNGIESGGTYHWILWKLASASEPTSYSWGTATICMGGMSVWRGVDSTRPFEDWAFDGARSTTTSATFPACGGGTTDRVVLRIYGQVGSTRADVSWGSGITELFNVSDATSGRAILAKENSVNVSSRTVTLSSPRYNWTTLTLVLLPSGEQPQTIAGLRHEAEYSSGASSVTSVQLRGGFATEEDYLVIAAVHSTSSTATAPSGFSLIAQGDIDTNLRLSVWGKQATTTEPATYTVSFSSSTQTSVILAMFRKVSRVLSYESVVGSGVTNITLPSVSYEAQTAIDVRVLGMSNTNTPSSPSGFFVIVWTYRVSGKPVMAMFRVLENQTSTGTVTISYSNTVNVRGYTIVLAPSAPVQFTASAVGAGFASAQLGIDRALGGSVRGESALLASLERTATLDARAIGSSILSGALQRDVFLETIAIGASSSTGMLAIARELAATAVGSGHARGDLSTILAVLLAARALGATGTIAGLLVERPLVATAIGSGSATSALDVVRALSASAIGETTGRGSLVVARALAARALGSSVVETRLAVLVRLAGHAVGSTLVLAPTALDLSMSETHARATFVLMRPWGAIDGESETSGIVGDRFFVPELVIDATGSAGFAVARLALRSLVPTPTAFATGVLDALAALEPGDVLPLIAPLAPGGGAVGLCRVLAVEGDPERGEVQLTVQFIGQLDREDVDAFQDVGRVRVAVDRATNLGRIVREMRRR